MVSMAALAEKLCAGVIRLNGQEIPAKAVSAGDTDRLARLLPGPLPPMVQEKGKGSLAPMVEDRTDPAFQAEHGKWFKVQLTLQVAVAASLTTKGGKGWDPSLDDEALKKWCEDAVTELKAACSEADLWGAWRIVRDLGNSYGAARDELVVEVRPPAEGEEPAQTLETWTLPERYGQTPAAALLRCCERFSIDPFLAFGVKRDHPGMWSILKAYEDIRVSEEARAAV